MTADPDWKGAREDAAKRHNVTLRQHVGYPVSYGTGVYMLCGCGSFKGTFLGFEEHCRKVCIDVPVASR